MLALLPQAALLVADAGYCGFELTKRLLQQKVSFLLRMSSNVTLYTEKQVALAVRSPSLCRRARPTAHPDADGPGP